MRNERNLREHTMPSNRWVVLALLFAVRVSTGIQYQAVASLSPQLMSGFVLSIADIGLLIGLYHAPGTILAFPGGAIGAWRRRCPSGSHRRRRGNAPGRSTGLTSVAAQLPARPPSALIGLRSAYGTYETYRLV